MFDINYWTTLLSRWAKNELESIGYPQEPQQQEDDTTVHPAVELATRCRVLIHSQHDIMFNIVISSTSPLYKFLCDNPEKVRDCVFLLDEKTDHRREPFGLKYIEKHSVTDKYIVYENCSFQRINILDSCSYIETMTEEMAKYKVANVTLWQKVLSLFNLREFLND